MCCPSFIEGPSAFHASSSTSIIQKDQKNVCRYINNMFKGSWKQCSSHQVNNGLALNAEIMRSVDYVSPIDVQEIRTEREKAAFPPGLMKDM